MNLKERSHIRAQTVDVPRGEEPVGGWGEEAGTGEGVEGGLGQTEEGWGGSSLSSGLDGWWGVPRAGQVMQAAGCCVKGVLPPEGLAPDAPLSAVPRLPRGDLLSGETRREGAQG